jgi:hypothetical protein
LEAPATTGTFADDAEVTAAVIHTMAAGPSWRRVMIFPDVEPESGTERVRGRQGLHLLGVGVASGLDVSWGAGT